MGDWRRLCVDLDAAGNVVGASVERHSDTDVVEVTTWTPAPFDTPQEAFAAALATVPIQERLFA